MRRTKHIITERMNDKTYFLRRFHNDWRWITDIIDEGKDLFDICDYPGARSYMIAVIENSTVTYLYNYFDNEKTDEFKMLLEFLLPKVYKKFGEMVRDYYLENKFECDEQ